VTPNGDSKNGESRLDRIERMLEFVSHDIVRMQAAQSQRDEEHRAFLAAQRKTEESQQKTEETIRRVTEEFAQEHQLLLKAQVVLTDRVEKLTEAQKHTDARLNALIAAVDGVVRRSPPPQA
jgi:endonuclease/exonuclease/phosphatase family metal-dependent hydrolase